MDREVLLGMTASLTGRYRIQGAQALAGARLWVQAVNRAGGLPVRERGGRLPVRLIDYDDESDRRRAAAYARRLLAMDGVDLLLGPYSSDLTQAAAPVAEEFRTVLWNHGGAADALYERGYAWIVGILSPASSYFAGVLALTRSKNPAAARLVLVGPLDRPFTASVLTGAEQQARTLGFEVVHRENHRGGIDELDGLLEALRENQPELVLAAGTLEDDVRLAGALVDARIPTRAVALVAAGVAQFQRCLGDAAEGFLGPSQWEPRPPPQRLDTGLTGSEFARRLESFTGGPPDYPAAQAYATGLVIEKCVDAAGTLEAEALRRVAGELDFTTFYGPFRIDPISGRQVGHRPVVVQWRRGQKHVVWPT